jgi:hypothetical protein
MNYYNQLNYPNTQLGYCQNETIKSAGCYCVSLAMMSGLNPIETNEKLKQKGYVQGCLVSDFDSAESLGLQFEGESSNQPDYTCIGWTNHYASSGYPQHFFVVFTDGTINDPILGERIVNPYIIIGYKLYKEKGDDVSTEQAKMLIYKATRGREAEGGERAWALGSISVDELAEIRFKDDVISSIWRGGLGTSCPESEKTHWSNTAKGTSNFNPNDLAQQWYNEHVAVECERCSSLQTELGHLLTQTTKAKEDLKVCETENIKSDKIIASFGEIENNLNNIIKQKDEQISNCQKDFWTYLKDRIKKFFKKE